MHNKPTLAGRAQLLELLKERTNGYTIEEICRALCISTGHKRSGHTIAKRLALLVQDLRVVHKHKRYSLPPQKQGRIAIAQQGYGFVECADAQVVFVPSRYMQGALDGDLVVVTAVAGERGFTGCVLTITQRHLRSVIGRVVVDKGRIVLEPHRPLNREIKVVQCAHHVQTGDLVSATVTAYGNTRLQVAIDAKLDTKIQPNRDANDTQLDAIIAHYQLPYTFSQQCTQHATTHSTHIAADSKRIDITHLPFVTIDGATAKDYDDAVYVESTASGWVVWVAIADVSAFVKQGDALDMAAFERGTSVYFDTMTLPMLPSYLSDNICSLKPHENRLVFVCKLHLNAQGEVRDYRFFEALICSHARFTYKQVDDYFDTQETCKDIDVDVYDSLQHALAVTRCRLQLKQARGALCLAPDTYTPVIKNGLVVDLRKHSERSQATEAIEELMLLANQSAANLLCDNATLVRIHAQPKDHSCQLAARSLQSIGCSVTAPQQGNEKAFFQQAITQAQNHPKRAFIHLLLLRLLPPACYSTNNIGHFGLMLPCYTHFTSPIRRYSDIIVHRLLKSHYHMLDAQYNANELDAIAVHCSYTQKRAERATLAYRQMLLLTYAMRFINQRVAAMLMDINTQGIRLWVVSCALGAFVPTSLLGRYRINATRLILSSRMYDDKALGDIIDVRIDSVDHRSEQLLVSIV